MEARKIKELAKLINDAENTSTRLNRVYKTCIDSIVPSEFTAELQADLYYLAEVAKLIEGIEFENGIRNGQSLEDFFNRSKLNDEPAG